MATEWEVWYADGTRVTSLESTWEALPYRGVQVVRAWFPNGNGGIVFGDSVYGHPDTWKGGAVIADADYQCIFTEAHAATVKPSER